MQIKACNIQPPPIESIQHLFVELPDFSEPHKSRTIIFDMDETLIHCVDDARADNPDFIIPIQFTDEPEPLNAGINLRPHVRECLRVAN